jgi:D-3-phosphoglycerate dehydrogenase
MPVVVWSRRFASDRDDGGHPGIEVVKSPHEVAERSDILSVHLALAPETRGLVDASLLNRLTPRSYLINTARAEIIDAAALERAIRERQIRVGLDVFLAEPPTGRGDFSDPLLACANVYGTHHIGASTDQAQEAIAAEAVRVVVSYKDTGRVPNVVNLARKTPATRTLVVRHLDRPGVLAHVLEYLRGANINVQEMDNVVFDGAEAAVARINLDGDPPEHLLQMIQNGNRNILDLHVVML